MDSEISVEISRIYISFFNRAADPDGLQYWVNRYNEAVAEGRDGKAFLEDIADSFAQSPEAKAIYETTANPTDAQIEDYIKEAYDNMFGRQPDEEGLAYWVGRWKAEIAEGKPGVRVLFEIENAARGSSNQNDVDALQNKAEVAAKFTNDFIASGAEWTNADFSKAKDIVDGVDHTPESVQQAEEKIVEFIQEKTDPDGGQVPGPIGGGGGGSPTPSYDVNAGEDLQEAISSAAPGATIYVGPGEFHGVYEIASDITIVGHSDTKIVGGFHLVESGDKVSLKNLNITASSAPENAAILASTGSTLKHLTLDGVNISGTKTEHGLLLNEVYGPTSAKIDISNSSFAGLNSGIYAGVDRGHQFTIQSSSFSQNNAGIGGVGNGAGLTISDSKFTGNAYDDVGVEGNAVLRQLVLNNNTELTKFNVYAKDGPHLFNATSVNESNVKPVGIGQNISSTLSTTDPGTTILLGSGVHSESITLNTEAILKGVSGAKLLGQTGASTITLSDGADGSVISNLHIVAAPGGNAVFNLNEDVRDVVLIGNSFTAGSNTSGALVYLNPGANGWLIKNNEFNGPYLKQSPLLGIEGSGHAVIGNTFGEVGGTYQKVEVFTASVVLEGNTGAGGIYYARYGTSLHDGKFDLILTKITDLTGKMEQQDGFVSISDSPSDSRGNSLHFVSEHETGGRLRFNEVFSSDKNMKLSDVDVLQLDFLKVESSRNDMTPSIRLIVDADGNLDTKDDVGQLVAEWTYQNNGAAPLDKWTTIDVAKDDFKLWQAFGGRNHDVVAEMRNLSEWQSSGGFAPTGGIKFSGNSVVLGFSISYGTWNGTGEYFIDNFAIGTTGSPGDNKVYLYDFA